MLAYELEFIANSLMFRGLIAAGFVDFDLFGGGDGDHVASVTGAQGSEPGAVRLMSV